MKTSPRETGRLAPFRYHFKTRSEKEVLVKNLRKLTPGAEEIIAIMKLEKSK